MEKNILKNRLTSNLNLIIIIFLISINIIIYKNNTFFIADDFAFLTEAKNQKSFLEAILQPEYFGFLFRPLSVNAYYYLCYQLFKLNSLGYHIINFIVHLSNIVLIYTIFFIISNDKISSLIGTLFFSTRCVNFVTLNWITCIQDLLATFFYLLSLLFYLLYLIKGNLKFLFILSLTFFLSLLSKETPITYAFAVFFIEFSKFVTKRINLKNFAMLSFLISITLILYFVLRFIFTTPSNSEIIKFDFSIIFSNLYYLLTKWINIYHPIIFLLVLGSLIIIILKSFYNQSIKIVLTGIILFLISITPYLIIDKKHPFYMYLPLIWISLSVVGFYKAFKNLFPNFIYLSFCGVSLIYFLFSYTLGISIYKNYYSLEQANLLEKSLNYVKSNYTIKDYTKICFLSDKKLNTKVLPIDSAFKIGFENDTLDAIWIYIEEPVHKDLIKECIDTDNVITLYYGKDNFRIINFKGYKFPEDYQFVKIDVI